MGILRMHQKDEIHFVTNRCFQERLLMLPSQAVNFILGYWFSRALEKHGQGLEIYAFVFLSNHFHLLLKDTKGSLADFMGYFQGNAAKAINEQIGRKGKFWAREYDDVLVDNESDEDFLNRYSYILCNAVKAGLVDTAAEWGGWNSLHGALTGQAYSFTAEDRSKKHQLTRHNKKVDKSQYTETYGFQLAVPPLWADLNVAERAQRIREQLRAREAEFRATREQRPALGMKLVLQQNRLSRPLKSSFRNRITVFASNETRRKEMLEQRKTFTALYRQTYDQQRKAIFHRSVKGFAASGPRLAVEWPEWSYPPSMNRPIYPAALMAA